MAEAAAMGAATAGAVTEEATEDRTPHGYPGERTNPESPLAFAPGYPTSDRPCFSIKAAEKAVRDTSGYPMSQCRLGGARVGAA